MWLEHCAKGQSEERSQSYIGSGGHWEFGFYSNRTEKHLEGFEMRSYHGVISASERPLWADV